MDRDSFIESLNEDLRTEFQSVVQYVQHRPDSVGVVTTD
jgi:bacterioferritin (cytochrome b1)